MVSFVPVLAAYKEEHENEGFFSMSHQLLKNRIMNFGHEQILSQSEKVSGLLEIIWFQGVDAGKQNSSGRLMHLIILLLASFAIIHSKSFMNWDFDSTIELFFKRSLISFMCLLLRLYFWEH